MTDLNHSIYYSYQTLVENQIFIFSKFFVIYWAKRKLLDWRILNRPIVTIFFLQKKTNKFYTRVLYGEQIEWFESVIFNLSLRF
jgi:hypothetical protein